MSDRIIETVHLTKMYGDVLAVDRLDWSVPDGSICGMLGPNGAGKTTTLKILLGMTRATSGNARVRGLDAASQSTDILKFAAFVPEDKMLYENMRVEDFLRFYGSFFPGWSAELADSFISKWKISSTIRTNALSKGNRTRVLLAAAMSRKPDLLIFDEPTEGLDPAGIEEVLSSIAAWASEGTRTVLIATHRLDEVERICDRIAIVNHGRLLLSGDLDDIRTQWKMIYAIGDAPVEAIRKWENVQNAEREGLRIRITVSSGAESIGSQLRNQYHISNVETQNMNLREIYLATTGYKGGTSHDRMENMA
ncbi:ABC transporter ATP-binding protein [bacterium]|nr:ABC transporter ATP-binding protein [bacterium]